MSIEAPFAQFRKEFEKIVTDYVMSTFAGVLLHPVVPLGDIQFAISHNNSLRRQVVHPVQDRRVEQRFL